MFSNPLDSGNRKPTPEVTVKKFFHKPHNLQHSEKQVMTTTTLLLICILGAGVGILYHLVLKLRSELTEQLELIEKVAEKVLANIKTTHNLSHSIVGLNSDQSTNITKFSEMKNLLQAVETNFKEYTEELQVWKEKERKVLNSHIDRIKEDAVNYHEATDNQNQCT